MTRIGLMPSWLDRLVGVALVGLTLACATGCGHGTAKGTAFRKMFGTEVGAVAMPPGARIGFLALDLKNVSGRTVTLESVSLGGSGIGSVARISKVEAAPLTSSIQATPEGVYVTDPPVSEQTDGCHVQVLAPIKGFVLKANHDVRIWVVFEAVKTGKYRVPSNAVRYQLDGKDYQQTMPLAYYGSVSASAAVPSPDASVEQPCLSRTTLLNSSTI